MDANYFRNKPTTAERSDLCPAPEAADLQPGSKGKSNSRKFAQLADKSSMQKIQLSKCFVNPEVEEAALRALRSGQYILASECKAFEAELAAHTGTKHAILGSSWTMIVYMLHLAQRLK